MEHVSAASRVSKLCRKCNFSLFLHDTGTSQALQQEDATKYSIHTVPIKQPYRQEKRVPRNRLFNTACCTALSWSTRYSQVKGKFNFMK